jgi:hypothetical protein
MQQVDRFRSRNEKGITDYQFCLVQSHNIPGQCLHHLGSGVIDVRKTRIHSRAIQLRGPWNKQQPTRSDHARK